MKDTSKASKDRMAELNNALIEVLDKCDLQPLESLAVLRLLITRMERGFEVSVMPRRFDSKRSR